MAGKNKKKIAYQLAEEMAKNNDYPFHLAALVWRNGKLVRIGINSGRNSVSAMRHYAGKGANYALHAELDALRGAMPGDTIEVIRWRKDGTRTMAKPCKHCAARLRTMEIKVWYTNTDGNWEQL